MGIVSLMFCLLSSLDGIRALSSNVVMLSQVVWKNFSGFVCVCFSWLQRELDSGS